MARPEYTALLSHWPGASPGGVVKAPDGGCQSGILLDAGQCASLDGGLFHEPRDQAVNTAGGAWEGGWLALEEDFGLLLEWAKSFRFRPKAFLCKECFGLEHTFPWEPVVASSRQMRSQRPWVLAELAMATTSEVSQTCFVPFYLFTYMVSLVFNFYSVVLVSAIQQLAISHDYIYISLRYWASLPLPTPPL